MGVGLEFFEKQSIIRADFYHQILPPCRYSALHVVGIGLEVLAESGIGGGKIDIVGKNFLPIYVGAKLSMTALLAKINIQRVCLLGLVRTREERIGEWLFAQIQNLFEVAVQAHAAKIDFLGDCHGNKRFFRPILARRYKNKTQNV